MFDTNVDKLRLLVTAALALGCCSATLSGALAALGDPSVLALSLT